jgi:hypothetical protein
MNIDERLEHLALRHEALTQSVELLTRDIREMQIAQREMQIAQRENLTQIARTFELALDSIKRLENVAVAHEERLDRLEGRQS